MSPIRANRRTLIHPLQRFISVIRAYFVNMTAEVNIEIMDLLVYF